MSHIQLSPEILNQQAYQLLSEVGQPLMRTQRLATTVVAGAIVWDFGVNVSGDQETGILLSQISAGGWLDVAVVENDTSAISVQVASQHPVEACLGSQYAGWPLSTDHYFAMVSGPGRGLRGKEPLWRHFQRLPVTSENLPTVLVLESDQLPDEDAIHEIAQQTGSTTQQLQLAVAPTHSVAGTLQIVARSMETALHQWETQGGPLNVIQSGSGKARLPLTGKSSLESIGRTNDAIIFSGEVQLVVDGQTPGWDWGQLQQLAAKIPSQNSPSYGTPFLELFEDSGRDFYKLDPRLFSPAVFELVNASTGEIARFGSLANLPG